MTAYDISFVETILHCDVLQEGVSEGMVSFVGSSFLRSYCFVFLCLWAKVSTDGRHKVSLNV